MAALSAVSANIARFNRHLEVHGWDETTGLGFPGLYPI